MQCMKIFEQQKGIHTCCIQKRFIHRTFPIDSMLKVLTCCRFKTFLSHLYGWLIVVIFNIRMLCL